MMSRRRGWILRVGVLLTILLLAACVYTVTLSHSVPACQPHDPCDRPNGGPTHPQLALALGLAGLATLLGTIVAAIWWGAENN